uniref:XPG-I domain-containing protein n=2 Tax=Scylla olivacea TaxID=85551 RepID=A0A0P4W2S3_SCYOL
MGVKGLWDMVSPTGEVMCLADLSGQAVAVDLAGWLVDTQSLQLGHVMTRPHLRNLFFRTVACLQAGVVPVMVLEGDAPSLKWNTISSRNQRNFGQPHGGRGVSGVSSITTTAKTGKRSHFNAILKKCTELFDLLGVPWVRAAGEAEATCAALNYHKVVQGVISQDSDVFLYGGNTVFRNFSANQKKVTAEKFKMDLIEEWLQITRDGMILLAIVLGCDYLPGGVHGVGRDPALRFLRMAYSAGDKDPTQRLKQWAMECIPTPTPSELASTKWKKGSDYVLEEGLKKRLAATEGFPFTELLSEFKNKLPQPLKKVKWSQPDFEGLVRWCGRMLDWEASYALQKVSPVVTRWTVTQGAVPRSLQPVSVVKQCVKQGVVCLRLQWKVAASSSLPSGIPEHLTTEEPLELLRSSLPHLVQDFEDSKKGKKKTQTRKTKGTLKSKANKENIPTQMHTITEYLKPVTSNSTAVIETTVTTTTSQNISDNKVEDTRRKHKQTSPDHKSSGKHSNEGLHQHREDQHSKEEDDHDEEEEDEECDERELSLIINRIINMKMNVGNEQHSTLQPKKLREMNKSKFREKSPLVQDLSHTSSCHLNEMREKTLNESVEYISEENSPSPQRPSLFDRASKRLSNKGNKHTEISLSNVKTEKDPCLAEKILNDSSDKCFILTENSSNTSIIGIYIESEIDVPRFHELETRPQCHDVSRDMFEDILTKDNTNVMAEDILSEDTLAVMFEDNLVVESSLQDLNIKQDLQRFEVTGCSKNITPICLLSQDCDLNLSSVEPDSPVQGCDSSYLVCHSHPSAFDYNSVQVENCDIKKNSCEVKTKRKLPADIVDFENILAEKQNSEYFSLVSLPVIKASEEEDSEAGKCWSLESSSCVEDAATHCATQLQCSTVQHSSKINSQKATTPQKDISGHSENVFDYSVNCETSTVASSCKKESIVGEISGAEAISVFSPQTSTKTNFCESKENCNAAQFDLNSRKEGNVNEKENLSVKQTIENHIEEQSGQDGSKVRPCDPFCSPEIVTLTLAQRLKLKCTNKQYRKLIDDLS